MKASLIVLLVHLLAVNAVLWRRLQAVEQQLDAPKDFPLGETMGRPNRPPGGPLHAGPGQTGTGPRPRRSSMGDSLLLRAR